MILYLCVLKHQHTVKTGRCPKIRIITELQFCINDTTRRRHRDEADEDEFSRSQIICRTWTGRIRKECDDAGHGPADDASRGKGAAVGTDRDVDHDYQTEISRGGRGHRTRCLPLAFAIPRYDQDFARIRFHKSRRNRTVVTKILLIAYQACGRSPRKWLGLPTSIRQPKVG